MKETRHFRQIEPMAQPLISLINETIKHITNVKAEEKEPDILRGEKKTQFHLGRKYLQGGGFLPQDESYRFCIFCKHPFVDEPTENKTVFETNRQKEIQLEELKKQFDEYKNGKRTTPPTGLNGKPITNANQFPQFKKEDITYHCHCYQMRCATEGTDVGSQCELKCYDSSSGRRYRWRTEDGLKKCTCPVCLCRCRKVYRFGKIRTIMAELSREDVNSSISTSNSKVDEKRRRQIEAQSFISDCIDIGQKSRNVYSDAMENMKSKGKNNYFYFMSLGHVIPMS